MIEMVKYTFAAILALLLAVGCTVQKNEEGTPEVKVTDEGKKAGERIAEGAKDAGQKISTAAAQTAMTAKITSSLNSAGSLHIDNLDVDTVGNTITLMGYVLNEEEKRTAGDLAQKMAGPDYTIKNDLAIKK
jgi:osmotically-inducible protein OsmY